MKPTSSELVLFEAIARGEKDAAIAQRLGYPNATAAHTAYTKLRVKFRLRSRLEVTAYYIKLLLPDEEVRVWLRNEDARKFVTTYNKLGRLHKRVISVLGENPYDSELAIAGRLGMSLRTFRYHLEAAYGQFDLHGRGARLHVTVMYMLCVRGNLARAAQAPSS